MAKILLVEDEPNSARALSLFLGELGHDVETATDGRQAEDVGREFHPDVLVTDVVLGGDRTGLDVGRTLVSLDERLRVIVVSGLPEGEVDRQRGELPVFRTCLKPLRLAVIEEAVEDAVADREGVS